MCIRDRVDRDKVNIKLDRGDQVSTLEIDVEMPAAIPLVKTQGVAAE